MNNKPNLTLSQLKNNKVLLDFTRLRVMLDLLLTDLISNYIVLTMDALTEDVILMHVCAIANLSTKTVNALKDIGLV